MDSPEAVLANCSKADSVRGTPSFEAVRVSCSSEESAFRGCVLLDSPAAEEAGKQDIQRMISTAVTNLQEKGVDVKFGNPKINIRDRVKLLLSQNEVYIPKVIAKEIGYDRLEKINNRGKRRTKQIH